MPGTEEAPPSVCYVRHALALDERRVKFEPEYIFPRTPEARQPNPRWKEVWFAGCHSDMYVFFSVSSQLSRLQCLVEGATEENKPRT